MAVDRREKMTNREWLETLSDEELASEISARCGLCANQDVVDCLASEISARCGLCANQDVVDCGDCCASNITTWLTQEYEPPKKELSQAQLCEAFELKFQGRRVITLDEIKSAIRGLFE